MSKRAAIGAIQINNDPADAARHRALQLAQHTKNIQKAEAKVWRRQQQLQAARRPKAVAKAERRLKAALDQLIEVKVLGSKPARAGKRRSTLALVR